MELVSSPAINNKNLDEDVSSQVKSITGEEQTNSKPPLTIPMPQKKAPDTAQSRGPMSFRERLATSKPIKIRKVQPLQDLA